LALCVGLAVAAPACTTFCLEGGDAAVFGQNYDWDVDAGVVLVNRRGVAKTSFNQQPPLSWTSKHGSVTFNQYGAEFPVGGMNERGLVIATMWLDETRYAAPDARPGLNILQWIQYQLDTSATVADVVASEAAVRIAPYAPGIGLHYLLSDASGDAAAIEVLDGRTVVHRGDTLPVAALANSTYAESSQFLGSLGTGATATLPTGGGSLQRFARAADRVKQWDAASGDPKAYAMDTLASVGTSRTVWSIVYDQKAKTVAWRTKKSPAAKTLAFGALDFDCAAPRTASNIHDGEGDAAALLKPFNAEANGRLVAESFSKTTRANLNLSPPQAVTAVAMYPESAKCAESTAK